MFDNIFHFTALHHSHQGTWSCDAHRRDTMRGLEPTWSEGWHGRRCSPSFPMLGQHEKTYPMYPRTLCCPRERRRLRAQCSERTIGRSVRRRDCGVVSVDVWMAGSQETSLHPPDPQDKGSEQHACRAWKVHFLFPEPTSNHYATSITSLAHLHGCNFARPSAWVVVGIATTRIRLEPFPCWGAIRVQLASRWWAIRLFLGKFDNSRAMVPAVLLSTVPTIGIFIEPRSRILSNKEYPQCDAYFH